MGSGIFFQCLDVDSLTLPWKNPSTFLMGVGEVIISNPQATWPPTF
jgi:hypothetical protein